MKLLNNNAIITGASRGLGKEIAIEYAKEGASLIICARDYNKLLELKSELQELISEDQSIHLLEIDITSETAAYQIKEEADKAWKGKIDILVNNAGIQGPLGPIEEIDWTNWLKAINVNLIAPIAISRTIIPIMKEQRKGKIINLSGGGATSPMPYFSAYAATKAAIVRLTETLALECKDYQIDVNAIAPGMLNTNMLQEVINAGPQKVGQNYFEKALQQNETGGASLENAAKLCVYLGSDKSNGISGKLISAVWDPWESLEIHLDTLKSTDIYNLRRIVPEDRDERW